VEVLVRVESKVALPSLIQSWWGTGTPIPERSAQRVLKIADQILKGGA